MHCGLALEKFLLHNLHFRYADEDVNVAYQLLSQILTVHLIPSLYYLKLTPHRLDWVEEYMVVELTVFLLNLVEPVVGAVWVHAVEVHGDT